MSFGADSTNRVEAEAIDYARGAGVTLIAAAGNEGARLTMYPAGYPGVLGVGATDFDNKRASFSNRGPHVDVVAPGQGILSTYTKKPYFWTSGTSMSTAYTSAVAALARVDSNAARYVLSEALSDRDQRTRANAVECIEIDPVKLVEYKDDDHHRVRANAVRRLILANNGSSTQIDRAANESLIELLGDPRPMHRLAGTWVAQRTIAQQHREKLSKGWRPIISQLEELASVDQDERLRSRASRCIRRLSAEIQSASGSSRQSGNAQG